MEDSFGDRREFERFRVNMPVKVLCSAPEIYEARAENISPVGVKICIDKEIDLKDIIELWLMIPDGGEPLYARGNVVWSNKLDDGRNLLGVMIEKINLMGMARVLRIKKEH